MNQKADNLKGRWIAWVLTLTVVAVVGAVLFWGLRVLRQNRTTESDTATDEVVAGFFKSLAALDVEESELAARVLQQTVQNEPREPALWANLAVAQMRLRDMASAREALQQAMSRADDAPELELLRAELLQHSGDIEEAIDQLRTLHDQWPENIAATYLLVSLLGQIRSDTADAERLSLLSDVLARAPGNLRARCEQARLAATLRRSEELRAVLDALSSESATWPEGAREQLAQADQAALANDYQHAARSLMFMENVLKPQPDYQQSQTQLRVSSAATIGTPLRQFIRLKLPKVETADAVEELEFELQEVSETAARPDLVLGLQQAGERGSIVLSLSDHTLQAGGSASLPFPGSSTEANASSIAAADLNSDFRQDLILAGAEGSRIFLRSEDGSFAEHPTALGELARPWRAIWAVDVEADGDLDLLLSDHESPLSWVRNNGDMTFTAMPGFIDATNVRQLLAADLDGDGDVDLSTLDTSNLVAVWRNQRGGRYVAAGKPFQEARIAIAAADVDGNGRFDLVSLSASGEVQMATWQADGTWSETSLTKWPADSPANLTPGEAFLGIADLDNNGALDLVVSRRYQTSLWLRTKDRRWTQPSQPPALLLTSIVDINGDGLLDLIGVTEQGGRVAVNQSAAGYGWHVLQTLANTAAGDKRINSFGVGGRIEIRAGGLVQAAMIRSPRTHFGLGHHKVADVARILWPNGTVQAEFDLQARQSLVAKQRLKGSCPWVFAFDGHQFRFVKDFIWRSPLGLRINAQDTAGVTQTEDWIKIPGEALACVEDRYLLRITAELWETHFFDHVSLLAIDHPIDVAVIVDERFVPTAPPAQQVLSVSPPQPLRNVADHRGRSLDDALRAADGVYADRFALGDYQGVAEEHWVEFDVPEKVSAARDVLIVGNGWVYPTDSSLNVAMAQGNAPRPFGLVLEQQDTSGQWRVLHDDLGFPAGKNKDVVITLPTESLSDSRRFRLRTNMEVYWDWLGWSYADSRVEPRVTRIPAHVAQLRYRGYSKLLPADRRRPDTPIYEVAAKQQRWLDLEGFYTRFGDVLELLRAVDDRYLIMNAGDELLLEFEAPGDVPAGWRRDFVLVGDGWVKDGDYNTAFSQWVRPLPSHEDPEYEGPLTRLQQDPLYLRHRDDWHVYHTRYVTPQHFRQGLWPRVPEEMIGESPR